MSASTRLVVLERVNVTLRRLDRRSLSPLERELERERLASLLRQLQAAGAPAVRAAA